MNFKTPASISLAALSMLALSACNDSDSSKGGSFTVTVDTATTLANDLRGLRFAASGQIYAAGYSDATADRQVVVARFNADGSPDQSFGGTGIRSYNLAVDGDEQALGIVELSNGDLIVAANVADGNGGEQIQASDNPAVSGEREEGVSVRLLRISSTGELVSSFGEQGVAEVVFGWADAENDSWPTPGFTQTDGFDGAGYPEDTVYDIQLDNSGAEERVVVFGFGPAPRTTAGAEQRQDRDRYVTRVLASTGAVDPSFNAGVAYSWNSPDSLPDNARRGIVEADGKIVSAGYTNLGDGLGNHVILIRLNANGSPDASFTGFGLDPVQPGIAVYNPFQVDGGYSEAYAVARQSDGGYVTTGYGAATAADTPSTLGFLSSIAQDLVPFRVADGQLDPNWGNNGIQAIQSESLGRSSAEERGRDMVVLDDDRTVHVGRFGGVAAAYVLTADGQLDTRVDDDGILEFPNSTIGAQFFAAALSADGNRVAMSTNGDSAGARLVVIDRD